MARHTTDRICTSCGSCRLGTVDPYTGELLVEVEIRAIPDDIIDDPPLDPGMMNPDGTDPRVSGSGWVTLSETTRIKRSDVRVADLLPDGPVYRDECRPGHRCLGGCHEGERCRSEVEREQQIERLAEES